MGKNKARKVKIVPIIFIVAILLVGGSLFNIYKANPFIVIDENTNMGNPLDVLSNKKDRINILIFGVDSPDKEKSNHSRSDSIMLLTMDSKKERPTMISIPRDTRVKIPGRKNFDKINHAHAYGGPELLVKTVEEFLEIDITYYVRINYNAVIEVVDALGGVEIDVPMNMKYSDPYATPPLNIDLKKGLQTLNGKQSVEFMRFRKGYANQDLGRIEAQQQFIKALLDTAISPSTILKVPELIDIAYRNVDTNISKSKMASLGMMATSINTENIVKLTLDGVPKTINGISYYAVEKKTVEELKDNYFSKVNDDSIVSE